MGGAARSTEAQLLRSVSVGSALFVALFAAASVALRARAVPLSLAFARADAEPLPFTPAHVTTSARTRRGARTCGLAPPTPPCSHAA
jgi:hypothetical protein